MNAYKKWGIGALVVGLSALLLDALLLETYFFQVKRFQIGKKNSNRKIKILLLTDLHFGKHFRSYHHKLVRKINALNPDLILISGDLIDEHGEAGPAKRFLSLLNPSVPKLAIPGNHDHKNNVSIGTLKKILELGNGHLLINETKQVMAGNTPITVTGVDDFIESEGRFTEAVKHTGGEDHHLLLVHSPLQQEQVLSELETLNRQRGASQQLMIQYIFAGHNHGGQVRLKPFVPVLPEMSGNYVDGWYNKDHPRLYVSKGFGTSTVPLRFGARSEITLFYYGV
jgi:predicted MPP superfamily phosphohydrolase